jgi:hypothetical protein
VPRTTSFATVSGASIFNALLKREQSLFLLAHDHVRLQRWTALAKREGSEALPNIFVEILQVLAHGHHELVGVRAINNAVIVTHRETDDVPHGN